MATIAIDNEIKERAYLRAKKENISLRFVTQYLLQKYADGNVSFDLQWTPEEEIERQEEREIFKIWNERKNCSKNAISLEQLMKEYNITREDLLKIPDENV